MRFYSFLLMAIIFLFGSLVSEFHEVRAEEGLLKTESIRQKLFGRMDDRKKSKPLRSVSENILIGVFSRVTDSESVWIRIERRSEYRKWTFKLSKKNLNLPRQEVRVWLKYVSPNFPSVTAMSITSGSVKKLLLRCKRFFTTGR